MSVESLKVYQKSYALALEIHGKTLNFPKIEQYGGLADQLRRSSKSVPANITEGFGRQEFYPKEFNRFLITALGSCDETILWLKMSRDLGYFSETEIQRFLSSYTEVGKMPRGLIKKVSGN